MPISSPVSPPLVSSLCPRCVLVVSSKGLQGLTTCCRNIAELQSFLVHSSSITPRMQFQFPHRIFDVSRMYHHSLAKTPPEFHHCTVTALSQHHPDHQAHCQTGVRAAPISVEGLSRHRQTVVSVSSIHRQRITASFLEDHPLHVGVLPNHCRRVLSTLSLLAVSPARYLFSPCH